MSKIDTQIILTDLNDADSFLYFRSYNTDFTFNLFIKMNKSYNYEDMIKNTEGLKSNIKSFMEKLPKDESFPAEAKSIIINYAQNLLEHIDEVVANPEQICFDCDHDKALDFLKKNERLRKTNFSVYVGDNYGQNFVDRLKLFFKDYKDTLHVKTKNDNDVISLKTYEATVKKINEITSHIKSLNLSPLEQVIYTYDFVRQRIYQFESENERKTKSRDLSKILFNDPIVCVGYSNYMYAILNKLGIKCLNETTSPIVDEIEMGHARNVVYIKDDKYGIDGFYVVDATRDSKKNKEDKNYIQYFNNFGLLREEIERREKTTSKSELFPSSIKKLKKIISSLSENEEVEIDQNDKLTLRNYLILLGKNNPELINKLSSKLEPEDRVAILKLGKEIITKASNDIEASKFLKAVYNVRKKEYYLNPEAYHFEGKDFDKIYMNSFFYFADGPQKQEGFESLTPKEKAKKDIERLRRYQTESELPKKIEQVHLAKTLRKVLDKKTNI